MGFHIIEGKSMESAGEREREPMSIHNNACKFMSYLTESGQENIFL